MRNILFLSTLPLILILSACGSSGTSQTEDVTEIDVVDITSDGAPIVPQEDNQATFVPGEPLQSARSSTDNPGAPVGEIKKFGTGGRVVENLDDNLYCLQNKFENFGCLDFNEADQARIDLFKNATSEITEVRFKTRLINEYTETVTGFSTNSSVGNTDGLIAAMRGIYNDASNGDLVKHININYRFQADNVDVEADQIDTNCFKSDFLSNTYNSEYENIPPEHTFRHLPIIFFFRSGNIAGALNEDTATIEFRSSPTIDCVESTSKTEFKYSIDTSGSDINIEILIDLGEVTFAPSKVQVNDANQAELASTFINAQSTFGQRRNLDLALEICSDGECLGPFIEGETLSQQNQTLKDRSLGTITIVSDSETVGDDHKGFYSVNLSGVPSSTHSFNYGCAKYTLNSGTPVIARYVGSDSTTVSYRVGIDFITSNTGDDACNFDYIHNPLNFVEKDPSEVEEGERAKFRSAYSVVYGREKYDIRIGGSNFLPMKFRNEICIESRSFVGGNEYDLDGGDPMCSYQRFETNGSFTVNQYYEQDPNSASGLGKRDVDLLYLVMNGDHQVQVERDPSGFALFTLYDNADLEFEFERNFASIQRWDLNITLHDFDLNYDEDTGIYNVTLNVAWKPESPHFFNRGWFDDKTRYQTVVNFVNPNGDTSSLTYEQDRSVDFDNLYLGCILYEIEGGGSGVILKRPWFSDYACPAGAQASDPPAQTDISDSGLAATVDVGLENRKVLRHHAYNNQDYYWPVVPMESVTITEIPGTYTGYTFEPISYEKVTNTITADTASEAFSSEDLPNDIELLMLKVSLGRTLLGTEANFKISKEGSNIDSVEVLNASSEKILDGDDDLISYGVSERILVPKITSLNLRCYVSGTEYTSDSTDCSGLVNSQDILTISTGSQAGSVINVTIDFGNRVDLSGFKLVESTSDGEYILYAEYRETFVLKTLINDPSGNSVDQVEFLKVDGTNEYTGADHNTEKDLGIDEVVPTSILCIGLDIAERGSYSVSNSECNDLSRSGSGFSITRGGDNVVTISADPRSSVTNVAYYAIGNTIYVTYDHSCRLQVNTHFVGEPVGSVSDSTDCSDASVTSLEYTMGGETFNNRTYIDEHILDRIDGGRFPTGQNKFENPDYSIDVYHKSSILNNSAGSITINSDGGVDFGQDIQFFRLDFIKSSSGSRRGEIESIYLPFKLSSTLNAPTVTNYLKDGTVYTGDNIDDFIDISVGSIQSTTNGRTVSVTFDQNSVISGNGIVNEDIRTNLVLGGHVDVSREYEFQFSSDKETLNIPISYTYNKVERAAYFGVYRQGDKVNQQYMLMQEVDTRVFLDTTDFADPFKPGSELSVGTSNSPGEIILAPEMWQTGALNISTTNYWHSLDTCYIEVCIVSTLPRYALDVNTEGLQNTKVIEKGTARRVQDIYFQYSYNVELIASAVLNGVETNGTYTFVENWSSPKYTSSGYRTPSQMLQRLPRTSDDIVMESTTLNGASLNLFNLNFASAFPDSRQSSEDISNFKDTHLKLKYNVGINPYTEEIAGASVETVQINTDLLFDNAPKIHIGVSLTNPNIGLPTRVIVDKGEPGEQDLREQGIRGALVGVEVLLKHVRNGVTINSTTCETDFKPSDEYEALETCVSDFTDGDILFIGNYTSNNIEVLEFGGVDEPTTNLIGAVTTEAFDYDELNNDYPKDGLRIIIEFGKVFHSQFKLYTHTGGSYAHRETISIKTIADDGEPRLSISDINILRDGEEISDSYRQYLNLWEPSSDNDISSGDNSASTPYIVNASIGVFTNILYSSIELNSDSPALELTIHVNSTLNTAGWIPYIKLMEDRPMVISDNLKRRAGIFSRDDYGVNYLLEANIQSFSGVDARKDTQYALWTLSENYIMRRQNERGMIEPDSNVNLTRLVRIENSLNDWNTLETGFHDNRTLAFMFQDENVIDVLARSNQKDAVIVIPVVDDSRRREVNAIPCPLSYLDRCQSLDREDRVVFIQGITNSSQVSYNLNVTDSNGKIYYKYSRSGCGGMNNCLTIPVDWTSTLKPSNGVAAAYYQHLLIVMSKALHLTIPEAHKLLMNLAEPISDEDSKRDFGKSIISFERLIDEVTLEPISRDRILSIINN